MLKHVQTFIPLVGAAVIACAVQASGFSLGKSKIQGSIALQGKSKNDYPALAKISLQEAIALVSKRHPGKIIEVSLDDEDGFLVYEFEVIGPEQAKKEILVDAGNGSTLSIE